MRGGRVAGIATTGVTLVSALAVAGHGAYLVVLTAAALTRRDRAQAATPPVGQHRFAVCVPAHNEELVIRDTVGALRAQRYPPDRFAVHVVADNCVDSTARLAADSGASVHVRIDADDPGKGPALNWLFDQVRSDVDVVVVIDADTIADPGFLSEMDRAFAEGAVAAQGHYGVRDPDASPAVALRYAALACRHHLRPLGRNVIGGSSGLYGNGMAFASRLLDEHRFSGHLIEDAEFQLELLLAGVPVVYVPGARVWAEMPEGLEGARSQNERWELGRIQLVKRFARPLVRQIRRGGRPTRRMSLDALADLLSPPLSALVAAQVCVLAVNGAVFVVRPSRWTLGAAAVTAASIAAVVAHVLTGLRLVGAPVAVYRSFAHAPSLVVWKLGLLARIVRRPEEVSWTRTGRNAEVDRS